LLKHVRTPCCIAGIPGFLAPARDVGVWGNRFSEPFPLDFSNLDLSSLAFSNLKLWGSDFQNTNLSNSFLPGAQMEATDFTCANFENAQLGMSTLGVETLPSQIGAKLNGANFHNAHLENVQFIGDGRAKAQMHLKDTCFEGAHLHHADITGFDLTEPSGLTSDQIKSTDKHPSIPRDFEKKPCSAFTDLCKRTPRNKSAGGKDSK
jgi:uncharacterized protein YjbI with pentapeptide repeats